MADSFLDLTTLAEELSRLVDNTINDLSNPGRQEALDIISRRFPGTYSEDKAAPILDQLDKHRQVWKEHCEPVGKAFETAQNASAALRLDSELNSASLSKFKDTVTSCKETHMQQHFQPDDPPDQTEVYKLLDDSVTDLQKTAEWLHDYLKRKPYTVIGTLKPGGIVYSHASGIELYERESIPPPFEQYSKEDRVITLTYLKERHRPKLETISDEQDTEYTIIKDNRIQFDAPPKSEQSATGVSSQTDSTLDILEAVIEQGMNSYESIEEQVTELTVQTAYAQLTAMQ